MADTDVKKEKGGTVVQAGGAPKRGRGFGGRDRSRFSDRTSDFDQKTILVRRVTRVVAGGRRFSLATLVAIGDRNGKIGLGVGKGADTSAAIQKAARHARRHLWALNLTKEKSLPHEVKAKYSTSRIYLFPNKTRGMVAGSAVRDILTLAGVKNVTGKILSGSKNRLNIARATIEALSKFGRPSTGKGTTKPKEEAKSAEPTPSSESDSSNLKS